MNTPDGQYFLARVKLHLSSVFERFGLRDVDSIDNLNYAQAIVKNRAVALRVTFDKREDRVFVRISRLADSEVPPIAIEAPKTIGDVREFELGMVLWAEGWERSRANKFGELDPSEADPIDKAVRDTAHALEGHASDIIRGDLEAWNRVAGRVVHRVMPRSNQS
jgi:hypothetical protein